MSDPTNLCCPITLQLFQDPVIAEDGHTYEKQAILTWIRGGNRTSPISRAIITEAGLRPNFAIKEQVEDYKNRLSSERRNDSSRESNGSNDRSRQQANNRPSISDWSDNSLEGELQLPYSEENIMLQTILLEQAYDNRINGHRNASSAPTRIQFHRRAPVPPQRAPVPPQRAPVPPPRAPVPPPRAPVPPPRAPVPPPRAPVPPQRAPAPPPRASAPRQRAPAPPQRVQTSARISSNTHLLLNSQQPEQSCWRRYERRIWCSMLIIIIVLIVILGLVLGIRKKPVHPNTTIPTAATTTAARYGLALLLSDSSSAIHFLIDRLQQSNIATTYISNGIINYSGLPDARNFDVVILITGDQYNIDMPLAGQQSIVNAQQLNSTGVVITELAALQVLQRKWQTLSQLLLAKRITGLESNFTFSLLINNHPVWTDLPKTFRTTNTIGASGLGSPVHGATVIANCTECGGTGAGVIVRPDVNVSGRIVQIAHAAHYSGNGAKFNWSNDNNIAMMMVNAVCWAAKLV